MDKIYLHNEMPLEHILGDLGCCEYLVANVPQNHWALWSHNLAEIVIPGPLFSLLNTLFGKVAGRKWRKKAINFNILVSG